MDQLEQVLVNTATRCGEEAISDIHKFLFRAKYVIWDDDTPYDDLETSLAYTLEESTPENFINHVFMGAGSLVAQAARVLGLQQVRAGAAPLGHLIKCGMSLDIVELDYVLTLRLHSRAKARK